MTGYLPSKKGAEQAAVFITDSAVAASLKEWRTKSLTPDAIGRAIRFALEQPEGVDINEVVVRPTAAGM